MGEVRGWGAVLGRGAFPRLRLVKIGNTGNFIEETGKIRRNIIENRKRKIIFYFFFSHVDSCVVKRASSASSCLILSSRSSRALRCFSMSLFFASSSLLSLTNDCRTSSFLHERCLTGKECRMAHQRTSSCVCPASRGIRKSSAADGRISGKGETIRMIIAACRGEARA